MLFRSRTAPKAAPTESTRIAPLAGEGAILVDSVGAAFGAVRAAGDIPVRNNLRETSR